MVIGLNRFRQHFAPYANQYVLIGGTACTVIMQESGLDFRATKDLDMVLYVEALNSNIKTMSSACTNFFQPIAEKNCLFLLKMT